MPEPREATTERLSYVIHAMLRTKQTGMLRVERSSGGMTEGGAVAFVNGQVVQASAGSLRGPEALNQLSNWGPCRFVFIPTSVEELTHMRLLLPSGTNALPAPSMLPMRSAILPNQQSPVNERKTETGPLPAINRLPGVPAVRKLPVVTTQLPALKLASIVPAGIPYRLQEGPVALQRLEQARLSRLHRRLFLMIDGKRTAQDLAHLMGKPPADVYRLIYELEQAQLIQRAERPQER